MQRDKIPTDRFLQKLLNTSSLNRFLRRNDGQMNHVPAFHEHINKLARVNSVTPEQIIKEAGITKTYGHQLFTGARKPTRDRVIQLAFGFGMKYEEAQQLLHTARKSPLYPKITRDAVIIHALNHGYGIVAVQSALYDLSLPLLGDERI